MHLQHLNSIERTASLDSACYDMKTGKMSKPVSSVITPSSVNAKDMQTVKNGFSELLKQTIISKAQENQIKRRSLMSVPESKSMLDSELEAALLSLDKSQLTQNLMREFINAR